MEQVVQRTAFILNKGRSKDRQGVLQLAQHVRMGLRMPQSTGTGSASPLAAACSTAWEFLLNLNAPMHSACGFRPCAVRDRPSRSPWSAGRSASEQGRGALQEHHDTASSRIAMASDAEMLQVGPGGVHCLMITTSRETACTCMASGADRWIPVYWGPCGQGIRTALLPCLWRGPAAAGGTAAWNGC